MSLFTQIIPTLLRSGTTEQEAGRAANTITPYYELKESDDAYGLEVWLPGVARDGLELTFDSGELSIVGRRTWKKPEAWMPLLRESATADYALRLQHDNTFDADKIHAELKDGILRVTLPKAEGIKPRKITVS